MELMSHNCFTLIEHGLMRGPALGGVYDAAMRFDKRVRFAAVVDSAGRILEGGMRGEVEPMEPLEKTPELISHLIARESAEARAVFFGEPQYSILVHEKLIAVILCLERGFILVTAERRFPLTKVTALAKRLAKAQISMKKAP